MLPDVNAISAGAPGGSLAGAASRAGVRQIERGPSRPGVRTTGAACAARPPRTGRPCPARPPPTGGPRPARPPQPRPPRVPRRPARGATLLDLEAELRRLGRVLTARRSPRGPRRDEGGNPLDRFAPSSATRSPGPGGSGPAPRAPPVRLRRSPYVSSSLPEPSAARPAAGRRERAWAGQQRGSTARGPERYLPIAPIGGPGWRPLSPMTPDDDRQPIRATYDWWRPTIDHVHLRVRDLREPALTGRCCARSGSRSCSTPSTSSSSATSRSAPTSAYRCPRRLPGRRPVLRGGVPRRGARDRRDRRRRVREQYAPYGTPPDGAERRGRVAREPPA